MSANKSATPVSSTAETRTVEPSCSSPDIVPGIGRGDFAPLMRWLRAEVHELGASLTTAKLVERATGRPLDVAVFKAHLKARYLA